MGIKFVDTTIRDGQASLWAMNMRTAHMLPVMPHLDDAGFDQMEFLAPGSRMKKFVRHLQENPWDWIHTGAELAKRTQLRWHSGLGPSLSGPVPQEVGELFIRKVVDLGIVYTRIGSNWNNFEVVRRQQRQLERLGMSSVVHVMYSVSPKHTDAYFVQKAREAAALRPYRLALKDLGGLLTPERTRSLLPQMMQASGGIPWEFHGHCNNGLGPLNALEAVKAGVQYVHTAVPPLANGPSQPSVYNVAHNLRALGYEPEVNEQVLHPATEHLTAIAGREGFPMGTPHEYEEFQYHHQVPGGMISNLRYQLELVGMGDRLQQTLEETGRVRAEFGYPIMVTPLSQFVGSQAAINVIVGERYRQVTDEVLEYALGRHGGQEAIDGMDPEVRARILDRPRARELEQREERQPSLKELRHKYGERTSDEELILRTIVGDDAMEVVRNAPRPEDRSLGTGRLVELVRNLSRTNRHSHISVQKGDLCLTMGRSAAR